MIGANRSLSFFKKRAGEGLWDLEDFARMKIIIKQKHMAENNQAKRE